MFSTDHASGGCATGAGSQSADMEYGGGDQGS